MPTWLLTQTSPAESWRPHLIARTLWVAEVDGEIVGFLAAQCEEDRLHINEVDVVRTCQGQGIGRRMLKVAADHARALDLAAVSLTTFRSVPWNAPFYASVGFEEYAPMDMPESIRALLTEEAAKGLTDRCAMRLAL